MSRLLTKIELSVLHLHARKYSCRPDSIMSLLDRYKREPTESLADGIRYAYYADWLHA